MVYLSGIFREIGRGVVGGLKSFEVLVLGF